LGEIAVDEYATSIARSTGPNFVPLAWISQTLLVHRGGESENTLCCKCCNNFSWIQERPDADRVYAEAVCI
jgi:hypothetical protein